MDILGIEIRTIAALVIVGLPVAAVSLALTAVLVTVTWIQIRAMWKHYEGREARVERGPETRAPTIGQRHWSNALRKARSLRGDTSTRRIGHTARPKTKR